MVKIKKLAITLDLDNDFLSVPLESSAQLTWKGLTEALPLVLREFNTFAHQSGSQLKVTLFCRADWQIKSLMGKTSWVFDKARFILNSMALPHLAIDLQWHPHLYHEFSEGKWEQLTNEELIAAQLKETFSDLKKSGITPLCTRIGECFFSRQVLKTLTELGISVDSTSFPTRNLGHTDWSLSPRSPFHPDLSNFCLPGAAPLLQAPFSMLSIHAPYESSEKNRYFNLIFDTKFTKPGIKEISENVIVTILHPFEILTLDDNKHQLFGTLASIRKNLELVYRTHLPKSIFLKELIHD